MARPALSTRYDQAVGEDFPESETMPHFFFDLQNGMGFVPDVEGRDLPDLAAAQREAIRGIRSIIGAEVAEGRLDLTGRMELRGGDDRELIAVIPFADAVQIAGRWEPPQDG